MKKIAFCFLVYDIINHEDAWDIFFKNVDTNKYNIYIHYKVNKRLNYFEKYKLKNCIETEYGHISLVKAQNILLQQALTDLDNQLFIFVSNSCIPLKSFNHIYQSLNKEYSYFNLTPQTQCFPRCSNVLTYIDKSYIQKASQWCILNRKHSELMLTKTNYLRWFDSCFVPDEHCYITNIFYNDLQNEIITTPNEANNATTFVNWGQSNYKYSSIGSPKTYNFILEEELLYLLNSKCLFGRKFNCGESLVTKMYVNFISTI